MNDRGESATRLLQEIQRLARSARWTGDLDLKTIFQMFLACAVDIARLNVDRDEFVRLCEEGWDVQAKVAAE